MDIRISRLLGAIEQPPVAPSACFAMPWSSSKSSHTQIKLATGARVVRNRLLAARLPARLFTKLTREARASGYSCSNREALPSFSRWLLHNWALGEFRKLKGVRSNCGPRLPIKAHRVLFYPFQSDRAGQLEPSEPLTRRGVTLRKGRFSFQIRLKLRQTAVLTKER